MFISDHASYLRGYLSPCHHLETKFPLSLLRCLESFILYFSSTVSFSSICSRLSGLTARVQMCLLKSLLDLLKVWYESSNAGPLLLICLAISWGILYASTLRIFPHELAVFTKKTLDFLCLQGSVETLGHLLKKKTKNLMSSYPMTAAWVPSLYCASHCSLPLRNWGFVSSEYKISGFWWSDWKWLPKYTNSETLEISSPIGELWL